MTLSLEIPEDVISRLAEILQDRIVTTEEWLTAAEAALHARLSRKTIYRLAERREIPHVRLDGGRLLFNRQEIDAWLQSHKVGG